MSSTKKLTSPIFCTCWQRAAKKTGCIYRQILFSHIGRLPGIVFSPPRDGLRYRSLLDRSLSTLPTYCLINIWIKIYQVFVFFLCTLCFILRYSCVWALYHLEKGKGQRQVKPDKMHIWVQSRSFRLVNFYIFTFESIPM